MSCIEVSAVVTGLDGEYAFIEIKDTGCGRCHEPGGCGGGLKIGKKRQYRVPNPGNAIVGDLVTVSVPEGTIRRSALFAYGVPLIFFLAGAFLGMGLASETGAILGSLAGLLCAWLLVRFRTVKNSTDLPRIIH